MATLLLTPTNPVAKRETILSFAVTSGGSTVVLSAVSAPPESTLRQQIDAASGPAAIFSGYPTTKFTFDRSGRYVLESQEFIRNSAGVLVPIGSPATHVVYVLSRVEVPIVPATGGGPTDPLLRHRATLLLYVADDTVVQTSLPAHGANSPALVQPATDIARWAAEDATVKSDVAACLTSGSDIVTKVQALITTWTTRIQNPTPATPPTVNPGAFRLVDDLNAKIVE